MNPNTRFYARELVVTHCPQPLKILLLLCYVSAPQNMLEVKRQSPTTKFLVQVRKSDSADIG